MNLWLPRLRARGGIHWEIGTDIYTLLHKMGFPGGSVGRNPPAKAGATDATPGSGRPPGQGSGNPPQYSSLGNPMDRGAWRGYSA